MSALAVYFEEEGIATTLIGLIRLHLEKVRPPRSLWVPFQLGRPLGPPNTPTFQMRVLQSALQLLEVPSGPVILQDFPEPEPGTDGDTQWRTPELKSQTVLDEIQQLQALHAAAIAKFGRSTVGISGLPVGQAAQYLLHFADDDPIPSPHPGMSQLALMRFAADDIKAFYLEAASAAGGQPSSRQLADWFWYRTRAAQVIRSLRASCLASGDTKRELVGNSLIPRAWL